MLDEDEAAVFRRGRNVGHTATPKSASVSEYRTATGMEALFGWLHLSGKEERISEHLDEYSDSSTERGRKLRESLCHRFRFDSLEFQTLDGILDAIGIDRDCLCTYCWTGKE